MFDYRQVFHGVFVDVKRLFNVFLIALPIFTDVIDDESSIGEADPEFVLEDHHGGDGGAVCVQDFLKGLGTIL